MNTDLRLRITEIFFSLQGESSLVGWPTVFVRLTGCPLRCAYCDTSYAFQGGQWMRLEDVLAAVAKYPARHVCVTGGEPLAQKSCLPLLTALCDAGLVVSLETSGAMDIAGVDERVIKVMDMKGPSSGEEARNRYENIPLLRSSDEVKFVIADDIDYRWAKDKVQEYDLTQKAQVLFSPSFDKLAPRQLAQWILDDGLDVRFQLQLHKVIWGEEPGR